MASPDQTTPDPTAAPASGVVLDQIAGDNGQPLQFYRPSDAGTPPPESPSPWADYAPPQPAGTTPGTTAAKAPGAPAAAPDASTGASSGPWADYAPPTPPDPTPTRSVSNPEATVRGLFNALTFGSAGAIAGLAAASGMPAAQPGPDDDRNGFDLNPVRPIVGAAKLLDGWLSNHPDQKVVDAYNRGRQGYQGDEKLASDQHLPAYLAGQLVGSLAIPLGGAGAAGGFAARMGRSALAGGLGGGLYGAGDAVSDGTTDPTQIAKKAAASAATGAAFGGVTGLGAEAISNVGGKVASIVRGKASPDSEAASRTLGSLAKDFKPGQALDQEAIAAGNQAGTPRWIVDTGGEHTRALLRSASNTAPGARNLMNDQIEERFWGQSKRFADWVRSRVGHGDVAADSDALRTIANKYRRPLYQKAYAKGSDGLWSPELERLMSSDALPKAAQGAMTRGRNRAVLEGFGGFNPKITFKNGILTVNKKGGVPSYPDLQFWDYVQRELSDMGEKAMRTGAKEEGGAIFGLKRQLLAELDRMVPEFRDARGTASFFFKAGDALEAGRNFVRDNVNLQEAGRVLAGMNKAERELFRRGFAHELGDQLANVSDNRDVLKSIFVTRGPARQKVLMAMGAQDAKGLEALIRIESVVDKARRALQNSSTIRQHAEAGLAGAGAVGAYEGLKEGDLDPRHIIAGALVLGAVRHGAHKIDQRVAERVAEMLMSDDPRILARGYKIVTNSPIWFEALRTVSNMTGRQLAEHIGPTRALAGALAGASNLSHLGAHEGAAHHDQDTQFNDQPAQNQ